MVNKICNPLIDVSFSKKSQNNKYKGSWSGEPNVYRQEEWMISNTSNGRNIQKVKVARIDSIFLIHNNGNPYSKKIIKDYIYSPEAKIIA